VAKRRTIAQEAIGSYVGAQLGLEGFMGFESRLIMFRVSVRLIDVKCIRLTSEEYNHVPSVKPRPLNIATSYFPSVT